MRSRYYIGIPDTSALDDAGVFAFRSRGAEGIASELQAALREDGLFQRWRAAQDDPDAVDPALGAVDRDATVHGEQRDLHVDLVVTTGLNGSVFKQRMRLLAGSVWRLNDVKSA